MPSMISVTVNAKKDNSSHIFIQPYPPAHFSRQGGEKECGKTSWNAAADLRSVEGSTEG